MAAVALVGRQTLAVFLTGFWLAQGLGALLDVVGHDVPTLAAATVGGCLALVLVAALCEWFKSAPWSVRQPTAEAQAGTMRALLPGVALA